MSKGFFHIDRRTWASICDLQKMNLAVAYLVLATGTGAANNVTKWSAKAIETWTGMRRLKAREAIQELIKLGYVMTDPESTQNKPRYTLPAWGGKTPAGDLIWLPNALVKGAPTFDGPAPVTQLRMSGDLWTLRLLIDLYHAHHLASDYGALRGSFEEVTPERSSGSKACIPSGDSSMMAGLVLGKGRFFLTGSGSTRKTKIIPYGNRSPNSLSSPFVRQL
jgi:hypothetical protein